jgi:hypothetical protein
LYVTVYLHVKREHRSTEIVHIFSAVEYNPSDGGVR